jgi:hypothetical protein
MTGRHQEAYDGVDASDELFDSVQLLPFVRDLSADEQRREKAPRRRDFWSVQATHEGRLGWALGAGLAGECVRYMCHHGNVQLLGWVIQDMIRKGRFGPIETGFLAEIGRLACRGARP